MTNVESMDYTHSHPSTFASLSIVPRTFRRYHTPTIYLPQNNHHTYLLWHFHSHSEIYFHATFHHSVHYDTLHHCHIALHDHVVDIVFVHNTFIHVTYVALSFQVPRRRHSYRGMFCSKYRVVRK